MKRLILLSALLLGTAVGTVAQIRLPKLPRGIQQAPVHVLEEGPYLVAGKHKGELPAIRGPYDNGCLYGFADSLGQIVVEPQYPYATLFHEGYAVVGRGEPEQRKFGLIDRTGREVIPCRWDQMRVPSEGLVCIREGNGHQQKNGYADTTGRVVVPVRYDYARDFSGGAAVVGMGPYKRIPPEELEETRKRYPAARHAGEPVGDFIGKFGFVDTAGREIIAPVYDEARDFSEGLAAVGKAGKYYVKWGYVDSEGAVRIPLDYYSVSGFENGQAVVSRIIGGQPRYGCIDRQGQVLLPLQYDYVAPQPNGNYWVGNGTYPDCAYMLIDRSGKQLIDRPVYDLNDSGKLGHSSAAMPDDNGRMRYGIVDSRGRIVLPFRYDKITLFSEWNPETNDYEERGIAELDGSSYPFTLKRPAK